jgi:rhodanese-related sulfurtransferase
MIVVYSRTGNEHSIAAQTLIDLGNTSLDNLDGGITAWTASGRHLVRLGGPSRARVDPNAGSRRV